MCSACAPAVRSATISSAAISRLVSPRAISAATCHSRALSGLACGPGAVDRPPAAALLRSVVRPAVDQLLQRRRLALGPQRREPLLAERRPRRAGGVGRRGLLGARGRHSVGAQIRPPRRSAGRAARAGPARRPAWPSRRGRTRRRPGSRPRAAGARPGSRRSSLGGAEVTLGQSRRGRATPAPHPGRAGCRSRGRSPRPPRGPARARVVAVGVADQARKWRAWARKRSVHDVAAGAHDRVALLEGARAAGRSPACWAASPRCSRARAPSPARRRSLGRSPAPPRRARAP